MKRRSLRIAEPCNERWEAMAGSDEQRACDRCEKHVHALSEMTAAEAEQLLASAPPGGICVRVEHDDDGAVRLRDEGPRGSGKRAHPLFRVAVGASLLAAGCGRADPRDAPGPPSASSTQTTTRAAASVEQNEASPVPAPSGAASAPLGPCPITDAGAPDADQDGAAPAKDAGPKAARGNPSGPTRTTMGCVCAPHDQLCDCL